jgi:hypothetical protein
VPSCGVVGRGLDAPQDLLGRGDLVRPHDQEHPVRGQHAVAGQDIEQRVLGEEGLREADEVGDGRVRRVGPPRGELEAVGRLAGAAPTLPDSLEVLARVVLE